jgi:hypothetical protein
MRTILLVSRDQVLQLTRSLLLQRAGYTTLLSADLTESLAVARQAQLVILGHTFTPDEQDDFIEQLQETNPSVYVICVRNGTVEPEMSLSACDNCLSCQPGAARAKVLEDCTTVRWSKESARPQRSGLVSSANPRIVPAG